MAKTWAQFQTQVIIWVFFNHHQTTLSVENYSTNGGKWGKKSNLNSSLEWPWLKDF
jgi:hypothetical protein